MIAANWDLPTLEERFFEGVPDIAAIAEIQTRNEMHQRLFELCAKVDAILQTGAHLRDRDGRLITHFDEWLAAAGAGRWP